MSHQYEDVCKKFVILFYKNISYTNHELNSFLDQNFGIAKLLLTCIDRYADLFSREESNKENVHTMNGCIRCKEIDDTFFIY